MNTSEHVLVIILSVFLALFLALAIIVVVQVLRLVRTLNRLTRQAEKIFDSAESVGALFRTASGPLSALRLIHNIVESVSQHKHKKKRGEKS
jgi:hypothetical protein